MKGPVDSSLPLPVGPLALAGFRVSEVSTCHITKRDDELLKLYVDTTPEKHPQVIMVYEHGYFVSTWHDGEESPENFQKTLLALGHSPAYVNLVMMSQRVGAKWLNLDVDGSDYAWLPRYSW